MKISSPASAAAMVEKYCSAGSVAALTTSRSSRSARGSSLLLHVIRRVVLAHHFLEAPGEGVVGELLAALDVAGRHHVLFVHLEQVADVLLRGRADPGHRFFRGGVDLAA